MTNETPLTLTGTAEPSALVQVRGGADAVAEASADADGRFTVPVALRPDADNTLLVSQLVGGVESPATTVQVTHDGTPPAVPELEAATSPTRNGSPILRGQTEANATITVTGGAEPATTTAGASGAFELTVALSTSAVDAVDNALSVVARDQAGNDSPAATLTITFDPNLAVEAPTFDAYAPFSADATVTLTGTAEPGAGITVVGGATDGTATVAGDGTFSVQLGLRPNQVNNLLAFAISGTSTSPSRALRITHDDVAPDAPELDPQASPTGATMVQVTGLSEPNAEVIVQGGSGDASDTADENGRFVVSVTLNADADNALSVMAVDLAGNASEATLLDIVQDSSLEAPITVDPTASPTSDPVVHLTGSASPNVSIEISGASALVSTTSDASGDWAAEVTLLANTRNELHVTRPSSGVDTILTIEHDDIAPESPQLNTLPSPTGSTTVTVSGLSEPRARVAISGATAPAASTAELDGRFAVDVVITADSETTLTAIATDRAGNASTPVMTSITHSSDVPAAPALDDTNPQPTAEASYVVSGQVANPGEGVTVRIQGGAAEATDATDPTSGVFAVTVTLTANAANELSVVSIDGSIESAAALVTVVHDDVAPGAPVSASLTASSGFCPAGIPTGGNVAGAMSSVEARARVRVENLTRSREATTSATDGGSFNVSLNACSGDVIRVVAVDAAGNESAFTEINAG